MDETLIWCALIGAVAYVTKDAFPSYFELTRGRSKHRLDAINDAVDDMEQTVLAVAGANEELRRRIEALESDVGGLLTRLDDLTADSKWAVEEMDKTNARWAKDADQIEYRILLIEDKLGAPFDLKAYEAIGND